MLAQRDFRGQKRIGAAFIFAVSVYNIIRIHKLTTAHA